MANETRLRRSGGASPTLESSVPRFIVESLGLKPGDKLCWVLESYRGQVVVRVWKDESAQSMGQGR